MKICDACHEREAVYHTILCRGDQTEERNLCRECFKALASPEQIAEDERTSELLARGRCKYCGGPAAGGTSHISGSASEAWEFWCEPCRLDLVEFAGRPEN